jgi:hypothetical protein
MPAFVALASRIACRRSLWNTAFLRAGTIRRVRIDVDAHRLDERRLDELMIYNEVTVEICRHIHN